MPDPVAANSIDFLRGWKPGGPWILCAFHESLPDMPQRAFSDAQLDEVQEWIERLQADQFNIYFQVNPCREGLNKKASKTDVISMDWFHVDVDPDGKKDMRSEQTRILKELQNCEPMGLPEPTVVLFSGGGYQAFWKLVDPIPLDGSLAAIEDAERYNQQVARLLGGDNCHNGDRIMRLPGTINWPNQTKRDRGQEPILAELVDFDWSREYPTSSFLKLPERQDKTAGIGGGAGRPDVNIPSGNIRRVPIEELADVLALAGFTDEDPMMRLIIDGEDTEGVPMPGKDRTRSGVFLGVVCELVRHEMDDAMIYTIVTDPAYKISGHPLSKGRGCDRAVKRAITVGKEDAIDPNLATMNDGYGAVESVGGKFRIMCERYNPASGRSEIEFHQKDGFVTTYSNKKVAVFAGNDKDGNAQYKDRPMGLWWLEHEHRRTYRGVTFYPNKDFGDTLNLWRGFNVDAVPGDCGLYLDHLKTVLCRGNVEYYDYLIGWMANAVQYPENAGQTAVVMRGAQGTGKGTAVKHFGFLFGMHYKHIVSSDHITGQFNSVLRDACVVFADECFAAKDKRHTAALKSLITEELLRSEAKGLDSIETRNCTHLWMATNSDWAVAADLDDRRFFVLNVSPSVKENSKYFGAITRQMENGGHEALLHFLLTYDLTGFEVRHCPKTDELQAQQEKTLAGTLQGFMMERLVEGELLPGHLGWRGKALKDEFLDHIHEYMGNSTMKKTEVNRWLQDFTGLLDPTERQRRRFKWRSVHGTEKTTTGHFFVFPSLEHCRKLWNENFSNRPWPTEIGTEPDAYIPEQDEEF